MSAMNGAKISNGSPQSRPPACEAALQMEGEAELSRKIGSNMLILAPFMSVIL